MSRLPPKFWETIVVGAGPAGLTAALYLGRYRRRVLVLHDDTARALNIPLTHNAPGFDQGISGPDLIARMTSHALEYGAEIEEVLVTRAARCGDGFELLGKAGQTLRARTLILATGLRLNQIPIDAETYQSAINAGVLRYCPVCDGYEHIDARIGVIGCDTQGAADALFLRRYSADVTLLPKAYANLKGQELQQLEGAGVTTIEAPVRRYRVSELSMSVGLADRRLLEFDVVYPALGCRPRTELARMLGIPVGDDGCLPADTPFESVVPGLYSAGDVVEGLDQINVAIAHGAIAATKAHNWLRAADGEALATED